VTVYRSVWLTLHSRPDWLLGQSGVSIFFLDPGKRISRLPRIETSSDCTTIGLLSLVAPFLLSADRLFVHRGRGPHTRRTDTAKKRTVVYLSSRGQREQMFRPLHTDNHRRQSVADCNHSTDHLRSRLCSSCHWKFLRHHRRSLSTRL